MHRFAASGVDTVGLDAVQEQVPRYSKSRFVDAGRVRLMSRPNIIDSPLSNEEIKIPEGLELSNIREVENHLLATSDFEHTGLLRQRLWTKESLWSREDVYGYVLSDPKQTHSRDKVKAWIMVRSCDLGYRFGPLYAENVEMATVLLRKAMLAAPGNKDGATLIAETWPANKDAIRVFEGEGWGYLGVDYHRMWLDGKVPQAQGPGGLAEKGCFATFDAGEG
jgi:hypothetical protein